MKAYFHSITGRMTVDVVKFTWKVSRFTGATFTRTITNKIKRKPSNELTRDREKIGKCQTRCSRRMNLSKCVRAHVCVCVCVCDN